MKINFNGDSSPCSRLSYATCLKNNKYYSHKDKDLPKGEYFIGTEDIETWRREE